MDNFVVTFARGFGTGGAAFLLRAQKILEVVDEREVEFL